MISNDFLTPKALTLEMVESYRVQNPYKFLVKKRSFERTLGTSFPMTEKEKELLPMVLKDNENLRDYYAAQLSTAVAPPIEGQGEPKEDPSTDLEVGKKRGRKPKDV